jgi:hypothetical protein
MSDDQKGFENLNLEPQIGNRTMQAPKKSSQLESRYDASTSCEIRELRRMEGDMSRAGKGKSEGELKISRVSTSMQSTVENPRRWA